MEDLEKLITILSTSPNDRDRQYLNEFVKPSQPVPSLDPYILKGSNMDKARGVYLPPNMNVRSMPDGWNLRGFVDENTPNLAFVANRRLNTSTLGHEAAHVQQFENGIHKLSFMNTPMMDEFQQVGRSLRNDTDLNHRGILHEDLAELQGQESKLPEGQVIFDDPRYKKHFDTPTKRRLYEERMFPTMDKVFSGDDTQIDRTKEIRPSDDMSFDTLLTKLRRYMRGFTAY